MRHPSAIATLAAALLFTACPESPAPTPEPVDAGPSLPDAGWAFAPGEDIPENATMVSPEEFSQRWLAGELVLAGPKADEEAAARAEAQDEEDRQTIEAYRREFPNMPDPLPPEELPDDGSVRRLGDGNLELSVRIDGSPTRETFVTHGDRVRLREVANAIRRFRTRDNQSDTYKGLYDALSPGWRADLQLPAPEEADNLDTSALLGWVHTIADNWHDMLEFDETPAPVILPRTCATDVGFGLGLDHDGQCQFKVNGLMDKFNWPGKEHLPCMKDQRRRGSCVAFATNSALETLAHIKGSSINLSEQALYARGKLVWAKGEHYGDGLVTWNTLNSLVKEGYFPPYESAWNYNGSVQREEIFGAGEDGKMGTDDDVITGYTSSCKGYTETCSNTTHQAEAFYTNTGTQNYCGYSYPLKPGEDTPQFSLKSPGVELWDAANPDVSLVRMILAVGLMRAQVLWSLRVQKSSFDSIDGNGFVTFTRADEHEKRGNHATHIVGVISNARLHDLLPNAPDGAGGGYFIVKNSWGPCWGDGGYAYVPYDSVKAYTNSAISMSSLK